MWCARLAINWPKKVRNGNWNASPNPLQRKSNRNNFTSPTPKRIDIKIGHFTVTSSSSSQRNNKSITSIRWLYILESPFCCHVIIATTQYTCTYRRDIRPTVQTLLCIYGYGIWWNLAAARRFIIPTHSAPLADTLSSCMLCPMVSGNASSERYSHMERERPRQSMLNSIRFASHALYTYLNDSHACGDHFPLFRMYELSWRLWASDSSSRLCIW